MDTKTLDELIDKSLQQYLEKKINEKVYDLLKSLNGIPQQSEQRAVKTSTAPPTPKKKEKPQAQSAPSFEVPSVGELQELIQPWIDRKDIAPIKALIPAGVAKIPDMSPEQKYQFKLDVEALSEKKSTGANPPVTAEDLIKLISPWVQAGDVAAVKAILPQGCAKLSDMSPEQMQEYKAAVEKLPPPVVKE